MPNFMEELGGLVKAKDDALSAANLAASSAQKAQCDTDRAAQDALMTSAINAADTAHQNYYSMVATQFATSRDGVYGEFDAIVGVSGSASGSASVWSIIAFANAKDLTLDAYQASEHSKAIGEVATYRGELGVDDAISFA
jgi:hypothetical protein